MSETTPSAQKKKRNPLIDLLCIMLIVAVVLAVVGFVGKDNVTRLNAELNGLLEESQVAFAQSEEKLTASLTGLETANATNTALEAATVELEKAKADLEAQVAELEKSKSTLEAEKANIETAKSTLETEKANLEATKSTLETEKVELTTSVSTLQDEKAALEAIGAEIEAKLTSLQKEFDAYKADAQAKIKALESDVVTLTNQVVAAEAALTPAPSVTPKVTATPKPTNP